MNWFTELIRKFAELFDQQKDLNSASVVTHFIVLNSTELSMNYEP